MEKAVLVFRLRPARDKARAAAVAEALSLYDDLDATAPFGGPLSEEGGLFWISLPNEALESAYDRMPRLGYTCAVDLMEPVPTAKSRSSALRWRRTSYRLHRVYEEDAEALRESAPDRRTFLLETGSEQVVPIRGYRGDGAPLSRRGLPVCDARLLVNLVYAGGRPAFLDPFAGAGGVVIEAAASGFSVMSSDSDPVLRHGLADLAHKHVMADASRLPFGSASFDAVATEPPYDSTATPVVLDALREMNRVLKSAGRLAILCALWQADSLRSAAAELGLKPLLDTQINRKGLDVVALSWAKYDALAGTPL